MAATSTAPAQAPSYLRRLWQQRQNRNTIYLALNTLAGAVTGVLFWLLLVRLAHLPPEAVGVGYAVVALGTTVGLLAKGGLDTAILRNVPGAHSDDGIQLLRFGATVGCAIALVLALGIVAGSQASTLFPRFSPFGWALVAGIGCLLVITWLQDAYLLAEGDARSSLHRNLVLSAGRILLPLPVVLLALPMPVPLTWALALCGSALAAFVFGNRLPRHGGRFVPRREFLASAARNATGSTAEFLPGLLLAPLVLAVDGPAAAAYFGMAWTAAAALQQVSAAVSRSALAEMVRDPERAPGAIRRAARQNLLLIAPASLAGILLAPFVLGVFGAAYAAQGAPALMVLCASMLFVAPSYLYLGVLRAQERPTALIVFPAAMVAALLVLAPILETRFGLMGVASAWFLSNVPFGVYAAFKLRNEAKEVPHASPAAVTHRPHVE